MCQPSMGLPMALQMPRWARRLPLALRSLSVLDPTNFPVFLAGAVLATGPALVVFVLAQRRFLRPDDPRERT